MSRDIVVAIAREWVRTPFVWGGRVKSACADCTFVAKVYEEAGVVEPVEIPDYTPQSTINGYGGGLYDTILARVAKGQVETPLPGDLALFEMAKGRCHAGVVIDWPLIVHADIAARFVVMADASQMSARSWRFFTFW
jgi:cell wall-associated NlpC family hydrolase